MTIIHHIPSSLSSNYNNLTSNKDNVSNEDLTSLCFHIKSSHPNKPLYYLMDGAQITNGFCRTRPITTILIILFFLFLIS